MKQKIKEILEEGLVLMEISYWGNKKVLMIVEEKDVEFFIKEGYKVV